MMEPVVVVLVGHAEELWRQGHESEASLGYTLPDIGMQFLNPSPQEAETSEG